MSKVEQGSQKAGAAKKNKIDTDNFDLGGETPIERMDIVLPGQEEIGAGLEHENQQPLESGLNAPASQSPGNNSAAGQNTNSNNQDPSANNAPASENTSNSDNNVEIQNTPSLDGVDLNSVQSGAGAGAPLAPELNALDEGSNTSNANQQSSISSGGGTTTPGGSDEVNVAPTDIVYENNSVDENASGGTVIATLSTVDANDSDTHTYAIVSDPSGYFEIVGDEIRVREGADLDFETAPLHEITIQATDSAGNSFTETMTIDLNDLNEHDVGAVTDTDSAANTIAENASAGDEVGITASATDADGTNNTVTYSIDDARFEVASDGTVTVASGASFDAETEGSIDIEVTATSADGSTSTETFSINVSDIDEFDVGAVSDSNTSSNGVDEDASVGDTVGITALASDGDVTDGVTYSLSDDAGGLFDIDASTGVVTVAGSLDAETSTSHTIEVTATSDDGSTSTQTFAIGVNDVNETSITAISDSDASGNSVTEGASVGTAVGITALASDADATDTVSYSLSSNPGGFFAIDANTGEVTVAGSLDYETDTSHTIEVTATSSDGTTSTQTFTIAVGDEDEHDVSSISDTDTSANTIAEDVSNGDSVGITASATDADGSNNTVTYTLSDDAGGIFEIDANTGEVSIADASGIDYETATSHSIEVTATSADGSTSTQSYTINVTDVDEFAVSDITYTGGSVNETVTDGGTIDSSYDPSGATVATLSAVDGDGTDTFSYTITNDPSGHFEIVGDEVRVKSGQTIDFETAESHDITIEVTDAGGNTYSETITINVQDYEGSETGTSGADTITGTSEEDIIIAGKGDDTVYGGDGDDFIYGLGGNDNLYGGDGNDTFQVGGGNSDYVDGGDGIDTINATGAHSVDINLETGSYQIAGQNNTVVDIENVDLKESTVDNTVVGSSEDNLLETGSGVDTLTGGEGDDTIDGGGNTDTAVYLGNWSDYTITESDGTYTIVDNRDGSPDGSDTVTNVENFEFADGTVGVADLLDVGPSDIDVSSDSVDENSSTGAVVATLSATDNALDSHTYTITNDSSGFFEISGDQILVKAGADIDFEDATSHDVTIEVTDANGNTYSETITIDVNDLDEFDVTAVSDTDTSANTIAENVTNGDSVGITASATDADGSNNTVTYSLSDDAGGIFEIDASTGEVSIADASGIDYENATSHTIEVTATSADGSTSTQSYTINVTDVDEFDVGAVSDTDSSANTIAEDVSNGDSVGITASATDADGSNNTVTYSLSDDAGGIFEIDASTGEVYIADASGIDYESATSHTIEVTATSADGSTSTQSYTINVTDVDEFDVGAVTDTDASANSVDENASAGDEVGVTASASDADGTNNTVTYSVDDARFEVASDGTVTVASGASFDAETEGSIDIEVTATSADGSTSTETFSINVSDIDEFDVGAISDSNSTTNAVDENASVGDTVGITALASDGDVTDGVTYSLSDDAGGLFDIDASTGVVTVAGSLDAETATSHTIEVTATSDDGSTSTQTFAIGVNDVNETSITAISDTDASGNTVTEGASVGTAVGITALATDADATDTVSYSLSSNPGGFFAIDANTGEVTVAGSLDYETDTSHTVEVTATSSDGTTSTQTFTIAVGDEDEHDVGSISDTDSTANTIAEDVSNGDSVGITASATDADGSNNTVTYSLSDDAGGIFEIDASTGEVSIADASGIDYETATSHTIEVTATSADGSTSTQSYTINVTDVDEFDVGAVTDTDSAANTIAEDVSNGDSVGITASATDADGSNNTVTYSLSDDAGGIFEIDASTGEVSIADASGIDYENATGHTIEVTATSADGSTSTQSYTINVTDVDEFDVGAVTDTDSAANTIAESASAGDEVGVTASTTDADGSNNTVTYSVDDARFEVASDGTVTVASGASFDAETEGSIDIEVTATSADGSTSTETFSINVSDIDEFDVGSISDNNASSNAVDENASVGDTVGITALASDGDVTDGVTYSLSDDAGGLFDIDANTGVVTVAGSLDAETSTSHTIEVTATSDDGSTSTQTFSIGVNDVNETSITAISDSDASGNTVTEGASVGTAVGITAFASDADATDTVSYSLSSNPGDFFAIDANTGEVTVAGSLDYETDTSHTIEVTATSTDGTTSTQTFTIAVGDEAETVYLDDGGVTFTDTGVTETSVVGGTGDDNITGTSGDDVIAGNSGDDIVNAGDGNDKFDDSASGNGNDTVNMGAGDDYAYGGDGSDVIDGGTGEDFIHGEDGNDTLTGGADDDTIRGGDGVDIAVFSGDRADYTISHSESPYYDGGVWTVTGPDGTDTVMEIETFRFDDGDYSAADLQETADQTIVGTVNDDVLNGGSGNDTISGLTGDDVVNAGAGDDRFDDTSTGNGNDTLNMGEGNDTAYGGDGTDTINGDEGDDKLYGESGNDTITGGEGNDAIDGGTGDDTIVFTGNWADYTITESGGTYTVVDNRPGSPDGTDTVRNVEFFEFADGTTTADDVIDVGPSDIDLSSTSIDENSSAGTVVASLSAEDNSLDVQSYTITNDPSGFFEISGDQVIVKAGADIDFEDATSHDITIEVSDGAGSTYTETITINVADVDEFDVGAVTDTDSAANTIAENASAGDEIGVTASATDADGTNNTVTYSVDDARFEVASDGTVTVASGASFDAETEGSIDIEVTATSADGSTSTETFSINVSDIDEFDVGSISDTDGSANTIAEDVSNGDSVGITASASDGDVTDGVSYSLSDDAGGIFEIDASTGEVSIADASGIDYETATSHTIEVTATSADGSTSTQTMTVNVTDVDEFDVGAVADTDSAANTIAENASAGDEVGITASASDADGTNNTVTYSVDDARFEVASDGTVTVASGASFDAETEGSIDIEVTATSADGSTSTETFSINVSDIDEFDVGAVSDSNASSNAVDEDASVGDTVGITALASDGDVTDGVTYSLSDDAGGLFDIDANTGVVTVAGSLDAETSTSHTIEVTATSDDGSTSTQTFAIGVNDVNETSITAISDTDASGNSVTEGASVGTAVGITALATDADATDTVSYSLSSNPGGFFAIDANTGEVTVAGSLDYETDTSHTIEVTATSLDGTTSTQTFTIAVGDEDEHDVSSISDTDSSANTIAEDISNGDSVGITASATDADGSNNTVTYSLSDDAGGIFEIDASTGEVSIADASGIDYETATSHSIEVTATSADGSTSTQTLTVNVSDVVDENPTDIQLTGTSGNLIQNGGFEDFNVADGTYSLFSSDSTGAWQTDTRMEVWDGLNGVASSEGEQHLELDVGAETNGISQTVSTTNGQVYDMSIDVMERSGSSSSDTVEIYWNGELVTTIDPGTSWETVDFQVIGTGGDDVFEMREPSSESNGNGALIDNVVMEEVPLTIAEGVDGAVIGNLTTTDADTSDSHTYTISDARFEVVDDGAGNLQLKLKDGESFDYETETSADITVTTTDAAGNNYNEEFTINILDVNERPTGISFGGLAHEEDFEGGASGWSNNTTTDGGTFSEFLGRFGAEEGSEGAEKTFSTPDAASKTTFTMDVYELDSWDGRGGHGTNTGAESLVIEVAGETIEIPLDFNWSDESSTGSSGSVSWSFTTTDTNSNKAFSGWNDQSHKLVIEVSNPDESVTFKVSSTLDQSIRDESFGIDNFEVASFDVDGNILVSVNEDTSAGTVVANLSTQDVDVNENFTYVITSDSSGYFEISGDQIVVKADANIDYENAKSHDVTVEVTDSAGNTYSDTLTININDLDEFDVGAISDTDSTANTIAEDVSNGDSVGIIASATDADSSNNTVTYSLSDDAGGIFEIDSSTGEVSIADASGIDYENATSHTIEVTATSEDGSTSTQSYTINVSDIDEFDVGAVTDTDSTINAIAENASAGDAVGVTASATDADGTNNTVTYSVDDARFEVASDGTVTVASGASFDAETEDSIDIEVTAISADGSTSTETFSINVSDIDEFDVGAVSDSDTTSNDVDEDASIGDTVGITALATDGDLTDNVTYSLSDDAGGLFDINGSTGVVTVAGSLDAETDTSHTIEVTATSDDGSTSIQTFSIGINDVNETSISAISDSDGSADTVTEGASVGTAVGVTTLATDADASDTISYSLTSNPGDFFAIDANSGEVTVAGSLDYETDTSHTIEVTATSSDGTTSTETFTIAVGDEDEHDVGSISDTDSNANTIAEDVSNGDSVGITASATDADGSDNVVTYSLSDDAGGIFDIDTNSGEVSIADASSIDYETATSHTIEVTSTSADGSTSTKDYTIDVTDVSDQTPTDLTFDTNEDLDIDAASKTIAAGSVIGKVDSVSDVDMNDTFKFALTDDAGGKFDIDANTGEIKLTTEHDATSVYTDTIDVKVTDAGGNTYAETVGIQLGTSGSETLTGTANSDIMYGFGGQDTLNGGDGNDLLVAGEGTTGAAEELTLNDSGKDGVATVSDLFSADLDEISYEVNLMVDNIPSSGANIVSYATMDGSSMHDNEFTVMLQSDNSLDVIINQTSKVNTGPLETDLIDGSEHRLSVTWDNTDGDVKVYVDGAEEFATTGIAKNNMIDGGGTLTLGQEQDSIGGDYDTNQIFSGTMDDIRIFNDVRTATEIADNHDTQLADPSSTANLVANWQFDGESGTTVTDLANHYDLILSGDASLEEQEAVGDTLNGGDGDDFLISSTGGDKIDGGAGSDTVSYKGSDAAVNVDLTTDILLGGDAEGDTLASIENITGSDYDDTLTGDRVSNVLIGGDGNDTLDGLSGKDTLDGGEGDDIITAGFDDGTGDIFIGGEGNDTYQIEGSTVEKYAFKIDLNTGTDQYHNTYSGIENINGGSGDDTFIGDDNVNIFNGGAGNDTMYGGGENDIFVFGEGDGADAVYGDDDSDWTDTIELTDAGGDLGTYGADWATSIDSGSIDTQDANSLTLSDDADGAITLADGSTVDFFEIERIEF